MEKSKIRLEKLLTLTQLYGQTLVASQVGDRAGHVQHMAAPPSGMYSGRSLCRHPSKVLAQCHNPPLGSRRSVQPASLQLPCTLQFPSQFEQGSLQGALQKCRGNASVLTHGTWNLDRDLFQPKIWFSETPQYMTFLT